MRSLICLACFALVGATPAHANPEPKRCPVCIIGAIGVEEIVASGLGAAVIAGGTGVAIHALNNSASHAQEIAAHPRANAGYLAKMRAYRVNGRALIRHAGSLKGLWRFIRNRTTVRQARNRLPHAAYACGVAGVVSFLMNGHVKDAEHACIGAGTAVMLGA